MALEGTNTTLECTCMKNECKKKTVTTYWKFKDHNIGQSDRIKLSKVTTNDSVKITMTILNISRIDSGGYGCGINTSLGFGEETRGLQVLMKGLFSFCRSYCYALYSMFLSFIRLIYVILSVCVHNRRSVSITLQGQTKATFLTSYIRYV